MSLDERTEQFRAWAILMGCPIECIPRDAAIRKSMSAGCNSLLNLSTRVHPIKHLQSIRKNIFGYQLKKAEKDPMSRMLNTCPQKLEQFYAVQELDSQITNHLAYIEAIKEKIVTLQVPVHQNSLKRDNVKRQRVALITKVTLLRANHNSWEATYIKAHRTSEEIQQIMPKVFRKRFDIDTIPENELSPSKSITDTMNSLNELYSMADENVIHAIDINQPVWTPLRQTIKHIPNNIIWNCLNNMSTEKHKAIVKLASLEPISPSDKTLKLLIIKLQAKQLSAFVSTVSRKRDFDKLQQEFISLYGKLTDDFNLKMDVLNDTTYDESIVNEYLSELIINSFSNGELSYLEKRTASINEKTVLLHKQLDNFLVVIDQLRELYRSSEQLYKVMQRNRFAIRMVKEKMDNIVSAAQQLCNNVDLLHRKTKFNIQNNSTICSFDSLADSVLCSTKLDSSSATLRSDNLNNISKKSPILQELETFQEIPLNSFMSIQDSNIEFVQRLFANSVIEFPIANLLTPEKLLSYIREAYLFHINLQKVLLKENTKISVPDVPIKELTQKMVQNQSLALKMLDKISAIEKRNQSCLNLTKKYFMFLVNIPITSHIPKVITYKGFSYFEYMQQFLTYYNMKNGISTNNTKI